MIDNIYVLGACLRSSDVPGKSPQETTVRCADVCDNQDCHDVRYRPLCPTSSLAESRLLRVKLFYFALGYAI